MTRRLPPLNSLKAFEAAARLGSFSAAAKELFVTHGAVSRHIQQLETWLGQQLFERHNRRVILTGSGQTYLAEIAGAFDRIAMATMQQTEKGRQRILHVNALATFTLRWLLPRLSSFQLIHPNIEIRLTASNSPIASVSGKFDVAIRGGSQEIDGYSAQEFLSEVRLPVCSPAVLAQHPISRVEDLRHHTLLHAATYPGMWNEWLAAADGSAVTPRLSLTLEHFYLTLQAAIDGLGIAMGPTALVANDVAEGRLIHPFLEPALPEWRYFMYVPKAIRKDDAVVAFCHWLKEAGSGIATS